MKKVNKFLTLIFASLAMTSCLVDDDATSDAYADSPNLVGFTSANLNASYVADGENKTYNAPVEVVGPTSLDVEEAVTVNVSVDTEASTAIEGVHYELGSTSFTLLPEQNLIGHLPITIITEGIDPTTIEESPVLVFNIESVSGGGGNIVVNGRAGQATVSINYLCAVDLTGTYTMTNSACNNPQTVTISEADGGQWYLSTADGGLLQFCSSNTTLVNDGFITVVCSNVTPSEDVTYCPGNGIGCITGGSWDEDNGVLQLEHTNDFFPWANGTYTSTYVRID